MFKTCRRLKRNAVGALMIGSLCSASALAADVKPEATATTVQHIFVVVMENHDANEIYGDTVGAPYINNTLVPAYAHSTNFNNELPISYLSEPHYVWMEAGTNSFSDVTFTTDSDPSKSNTTSSTQHLATQIDNAGTGIGWMSYQQGITSSTGACPITSSGQYAAKHDPFIFFKDIVGATPSKTNSLCESHHKDLTKLAADLKNNEVATYNFITPNLCNDMHGNSGCASNTIAAGDQWLAANLPAMITYANDNQGVVLVVWDQGDQTTQMPFIAIGPSIKTKYTSTVVLNHSSILKSVEEMLGLPILSTVSKSNDLADFFVAGKVP
jgi:hypothetical protein